MTSTEAQQQGEKRVISRVRFSTELFGYGDIAQYDIKHEHEQFGKDLQEFFKGKVPVGKTAPRIGLIIRDSKDPVTGTAVVGDTLVYLGIEGEDLERLCNQCVEDPAFKAKHPITWWELITEETEKRRAEEKARRKEYSKGLLDSTETKRAEIKKTNAAKAPTLAAAPSGPSFDVDETEDANDLF